MFSESLFNFMFTGLVSFENLPEKTREQITDTKIPPGIASRTQIIEIQSEHDMVLDVIP